MEEAWLRKSDACKVKDLKRTQVRQNKHTQIEHGVAVESKRHKARGTSHEVNYSRTRKCLSANVAKHVYKPSFLLRPHVIFPCPDAQMAGLIHVEFQTPFWGVDGGGVGPGWEDVGVHAAEEAGGLGDV